ncbi:hypothetical protein [Haloarcula salinisoli]|uniref:Uncharacterized protein n=1 Tax=Haloarcula salinisoli TaxID=2487746 RepID=A0A8J7YCK6_9EURY|nr:hypothetical protein [Halomicroarcula salinisoli]MBX0284937.1 hypothetical protein [Halomicroarcula salinisoli]MBX0303585.1 hypothetical protein [Halomicroarcula salinisoli]
MTGDPSFSIPARPTRRYPHGSGVEYEGGTEFELVPNRGHTEPELAAVVTDILADGPYRYGDFHDLPMPLWLVRDEDTTDVFRVAVRDGTVRLHVLPETESAGLRRFYDRLCDVDPSLSWAVDRRVDP